MLMALPQINFNSSHLDQAKWKCKNSIYYFFYLGGYVSITSLLLVDLLGLEKMTNSFGILIMFQGIATAVGPPLAGKIYDGSKSYLMSFVFTGVTIALSGAMCFIIPCLPGYKPQSQE